jgi:hypothetical protein
MGLVCYFQRLATLTYGWSVRTLRPIAWCSLSSVCCGTYKKVLFCLFHHAEVAIPSHAELRDNGAQNQKRVWGLRSNQAGRYFRVVSEAAHNHHCWWDVPVTLLCCILLIDAFQVVVSTFKPLSWNQVLRCHLLIPCHTCCLHLVCPLFWSSLICLQVRMFNWDDSGNLKSWLLMPFMSGNDLNLLIWF